MFLLVFVFIFLHIRLNELTSGESLRANIALVENNARVGAEVAVNLSNLINKTTGMVQW